MQRSPAQALSRHSQRSLSAIRPSHPGPCCRPAGTGLRIHLLASVLGDRSRGRASRCRSGGRRIDISRRRRSRYECWSDLRDHMGFQSPPLQHAINQSVGTRYSTRVTRNGKATFSPTWLDSRAAERIPAGSQDRFTVLYQVHRRRADEGRDEGVGRVDVDFLRSTDLAELCPG